MLFAISETGVKIRASKGASGACDECRSIMTPKCGSIVTPHWAHKSRIDCDSWSESETEWHREWKSHFKPEEVEVTIKKDNQHHRADVHLLSPAEDGIDTIEFQHSSINQDDILCREEFYGFKKLLWVIDAQAAYSKNRINLKPLSRKFEGEYMQRADWKHGRKSFLESRASIALDLGKYKNIPTASHLILRVTEIGSYMYEAETEWGLQESERVYVEGCLQDKNSFIHSYKSRININTTHI